MRALVTVLGGDHDTPWSRGTPSTRGFIHEHGSCTTSGPRETLQRGPGGGALFLSQWPGKASEFWLLTISVEAEAKILGSGIRLIGL